MASGMNGACDLWLWDGGTEYEGLLLKLDEKTFTARLRQAKKASPGSGLGKRLPSSTPEAQRQFTRRRFLAHVSGTTAGSLFEANIENVRNDSYFNCSLRWSLKISAYCRTSCLSTCWANVLIMARARTI